MSAWAPPYKMPNPSFDEQRILVSTEMRKQRRDHGRARIKLSQLNMGFLIVCCCIGLPAEAQSWHNRVFDSLESGRALGDYFQPFLNNYYTAALPPSSQLVGQNSFSAAQQPNQLLTPATSAMLAASAAAAKPVAAAQGPVYDLSITSAAPSVPVAEQLVRQPVEISTSSPLASTTTSSSSSSSATTTSTTTTGAPSTTSSPELLSKYQADQQARDSSSIQAGPTPTAAPAAKQQHRGEPQAGQLSPAGKILDAVLTSGAVTGDRSAINASDSSRQQLQSKLNVAMQVLKARKHPPESQKSAASAEQQIVNQHARAHHNHPIQRQQNQHQRLMPTKHTDSKLVSALLGGFSSSASGSSDSSSSSTDGRSSSPLASLLSNSLRSIGSTISSRSSIVKAAISDNKLSRTLSTVSKSIGGNKYVASAGAAAALAALGLTVSKLLGPYIYSGSSSSAKLTDPLMTSGSYWAPSSSLLPGSLGVTTDRNLAFSPSFGEPLLGAASSLDPNHHTLYPTRGRFSGSSGITYTDALVPSSATYGEAVSPFDQQGISNGVPLTDSMYTAQNSQTSTAATAFPPLNAQYFWSYGAAQPKVNPNKAAQTSAPPVDASSGYYSEYYNANGNNNAGSDDQSAQQQPSLGTYISGQPSGTDPEHQQQQQHSGRFTNLLTSGAPSEQYVTSGEQIMSSASSHDAPTFAQHGTKFYFPAQTMRAQPQQQNQPQSRRSGKVVSIKLDETTRARLHQQLMAMQQQSSEPIERLVQQGSGSSGDQSSLSASGGEQASRQHLIPTSGSVDSSSDYASAAKWTPTSLATNGQTRFVGGGKYSSSEAEQQNYYARGSDSDQRAEGQQVASSNSNYRPPTAYLIIKPRTTTTTTDITATTNNSFAPLRVAVGSRQKAPPSLSSTSDNFYHYQTATGARSVDSSNGGWRSVPMPDYQQRTTASGTQQQPSSDENDVVSGGWSSKQQQQQQVANLSSSNENEQQENGTQQVPSSGLHRISRTSPQAIGRTSPSQTYSGLMFASNQLPSPSPAEVLADNEESSNETNLLQLSDASAPVASAGVLSMPQDSESLSNKDKQYQAEPQTESGDNPPEGGAKSTQEAGVAHMLSPIKRQLQPQRKQQASNNNEDIRQATNGRQQLPNEDSTQTKQRQQRQQQQQQQQTTNGQEQGKLTPAINDQQERPQVQAQRESIAGSFGSGSSQSIALR